MTNLYVNNKIIILAKKQNVCVSPSYSNLIWIENKPKILPSLKKPIDITSFENSAVV